MSLDENQVNQVRVLSEIDLYGPSLREFRTTYEERLGPTIGLDYSFDRVLGNMTRLGWIEAHESEDDRLRLSDVGSNLLHRLWAERHSSRNNQELLPRADLTNR